MSKQTNIKKELGLENYKIYIEEERMLPSLIHDVDSLCNNAHCLTKFFKSNSSLVEIKLSWNEDEVEISKNVLTEEAIKKGSIHFATETLIKIASPTNVKWVYDYSNMDSEGKELLLELTEGESIDVWTNICLAEQFKDVILDFYNSDEKALYIG